MVKRDFGKETFELFMKNLEKEAEKDSLSMQYDIKITADNRLYRLKVQPEAPRCVYLLQAVEVSQMGEEEILTPVYGVGTLSTLMDIYLFIHCQRIIEQETVCPQTVCQQTLCSQTVCQQTLSQKNTGQGTGLAGLKA